jgi:hypothetical protein
MARQRLLTLCFSFLGQMHPGKFSTTTDSLPRLADGLSIWCNRYRLYSYLDYQSPNDFDRIAEELDMVA